LLWQVFCTPARLIQPAIVKFKHQKNGNNGGKGTFVGNKMNPGLCFVTLMLQTYKQFINLAGWEATSTPLAIYQVDEGDI
jgi:hypothetical protein